MKKFFLALSLFALSLGSICTAQRRVVLDNYYNNEVNPKTNAPFHYLWEDTQLSGFSQLGELFKAEGATLSTFKTKPTAASLKGVAVYIIVDPDTEKECKNPHYMDRETAAVIAEWVRDGGRLLLLTNDSGNADLDSINLLAAHFGMNYNKNQLHPERSEKDRPRNFNSCASTKLPKHPLFENASKLFLKEVSSISCQLPAKPILIENGQTLVAEASLGRGYVLAVGDPWLYNEYIDHKVLPADFNNYQAARNLARLLLPAHPSLLIQPNELSLIKQSIEESPSLKLFHKVIVEESNKMLTLPCLTFNKIGKRLLGVSRECLRRLFFLSYSYQLTGDKKYAERAEREMLAVCAFKDWNPSHFLDVAEMTMGVALGYDWTFDYLSDRSRDQIANTIITQGLQPSLNSNDMWWLKSKGNWNQVCNAGMMYGAIAIRDRKPELAQTIIDRSLQSVLLPMSAYEPDGTYPEGYMYWSYGTTLNVLLISAAEKFLGRELFPVATMPGFMKSASYILHMLGPTGKSFNFSDCNLQVSVNPAIFWFARKSHDLGLVWNEKRYMTPENEDLKNDRFLPTAILWAAGLGFDQKVKPQSTFWIGQGTNPVCLMRSSWEDEKALYVGFKAGTPVAGHAHLDIGSFVLDAKGVRWSSDYRSEYYENIESKGIDLWSSKQDSERWKLFRYNNFAHSTLTFNDSLQRVTGAAKMDAWSDKPDSMYATSDLSSLYANQVKRAVRTVAMIDRSSVIIQDEIETLATPTNVRWTLLTEATPRFIPSENAIELTKDGQKLRLVVTSPIDIELKSWPTTANNNYEMSNAGTYLVGFEAHMEGNRKATFKVSFIP